MSKPLTSADTLSAAPPFNSSTPRQPRLTRRGKVIVFMTVVFGALAVAVSLALAWRIGATGLTQAAIPAVVTILMLDLVPVGFAVLLRHTYRLVLTGNFSTGIVVAANVGGITSWGVVFDFLDDGGRVVRGSSYRSFYTVALARAFHGANAGDYFGVGSYVPVLYRAGDASRNALYVSLPWAV